MSRTFKDRYDQRRIVKNSKIQKLSKEYGDDFYHKRKDKTISKKIRSRLKQDMYNEIKNEEW